MVLWYSCFRKEAFRRRVVERGERSRSPRSFECLEHHSRSATWRGISSSLVEWRKDLLEVLLTEREGGRGTHARLWLSFRVRTPQTCILQSLFLTPAQRGEIHRQSPSLRKAVSYTSLPHRAIRKGRSRLCVKISGIRGHTAQVLYRNSSPLSMGQ